MDRDLEGDFAACQRLPKDTIKLFEQNIFAQIVQYSEPTGILEHVADVFWGSKRLVERFLGNPMRRVEQVRVRRVMGIVFRQREVLKQARQQRATKILKVQKLRKTPFPNRGSRVWELHQFMDNCTESVFRVLPEIREHDHVYPLRAPDTGNGGGEGGHPYISISET